MTSRKRSISKLRLVRQELSHSFLMSSRPRTRHGNSSAAAVEFVFKSLTRTWTRRGKSLSRLARVTHLPDDRLARARSNGVSQNVNRGRLGLTTGNWHY